MRIGQIKILKDDMNDSYFELAEAIDDFIENPTVANRNRVKLKLKEFTSIKTKTLHNIYDFRCKGE